MNRLKYSIMLSLFFIFACSCGGTRKQAEVADWGIVPTDPYVLELEKEKAAQDSILKVQEAELARQEAELDKQGSALRNQQQAMHKAELAAIAREYEREKAYLLNQIGDLESRQKVSHTQSAGNWRYYQDQQEEIKVLQETLGGYKRQQLSNEISSSVQAINTRLDALSAQNEVLLSRQPSAEEAVAYNEYIDKTFYNFSIDANVHYYYLTDKEAAGLIPRSLLPRYNRLRMQKIKIADALDALLLNLPAETDTSGK